ncbi:MAG: hypothetical protein HQL95_00960 [Magnetococcales bacterium]|nr:hypothetical protein [Magnetococcales bacterium]
MRPRKTANAILALVTIGAIQTAGPVLGAAQQAGLAITSDRLEMDDKSQVALFQGHVVADDGRMRITADRMTVHYDKKIKGKGGVRDVKAEGQVVILQEKDRGTADVAYYQADKHTLDLVGNDKDATIRRGDDLLTGKRILLTLDENQRISKVAVQGGENRRVSARITPNGPLHQETAPARTESRAGPSGGEPGKGTTAREAAPPIQPPTPTQTPASSNGVQESHEMPLAASPVRETASTVRNKPASEAEETAGTPQESDASAPPAPKPRRRIPQPLNALR